MNRVVVPLEGLAVPFPSLHIHVVKVLHVLDHVPDGHHHFVRVFSDCGSRGSGLVEGRTGYDVGAQVAAVYVKV
jgi:hypothetical protein